VDPTKSRGISRLESGRDKEYKMEIRLS